MNALSHNEFSVDQEHQPTMDSAYHSALNQYRPITTEAHGLVHGQRGADYGHPLDDFGKTARLWSVIFNIPVSEEQVALAMVCVKISRELATPKRDNAVDGAGYFETLEMLKHERQRRNIMQEQHRPDPTMVLPIGLPILGTVKADAVTK